MTGAAEATLSADEVLALLRAGATAINSGSLSVAVVDRGGRILGDARPCRCARRGTRHSRDDGPIRGDVQQRRSATAVAGPFASSVAFTFRRVLPIRRTPLYAALRTRTAGKPAEMPPDTHPFDSTRSIAGSGWVVIGGRVGHRTRPDAPSAPDCDQSQQNFRAGFSTGKNDAA